MVDIVGRIVVAHTIVVTVGKIDAVVVVWMQVVVGRKVTIIILMI